MKKPAPKIVLTSNRDGLHNQIMTMVRLNRYDTRFMANIQIKYINPGLPLSTGQNELYEKIVHKYRKQLKKLKVDYRDILALPWENGILDNEVLRQQTYFRITDEERMELYFNFNKNQIDEVRALLHDDDGNHLNRGVGEYGNFGNGQKYDFTWDKNSKIWHGPFNIYLFKTLYDFTLKNKIKIEDSVTDLVNELNAYGTKEEWTPSVRIVNNRLYVNMIAETMLPYLDKIDMTDLSISNIERIAKLGLQVPSNVRDIAKYLTSGSAQTIHKIETAEDVNTLKEYILATGRKTLLHVPELTSSWTQKNNPVVVAALEDCESWTPNITKYMLPAQDRVRIGDSFEVRVAEALDIFAKTGYTTLVTTTPLTSLIRAQNEIGKFALEADKVISITIIEPK